MQAEARKEHCNGKCCRIKTNNYFIEWNRSSINSLSSYAGQGIFKNYELELDLLRRESSKWGAKLKQMDSE